MKLKLFVLGLDGSTFDCLNPLMDEGILPNLSSFCSQWTSGPLQTIFPPVTAPAWLAIATGLNPGKTGVFDYINKVNVQSEHLAPVSSAYYNKRAVWDYLGSHGYKVGIFNYPTLSPPPEVNGFAVSGMGGYKKENLCFPQELGKDLENITGGYEVKLNLRNTNYKKNIDLFFDDINRIMTKQSNALKHLVREKEWDFFFAVFSFTDWMQHVLWKDIDHNHPLHNINTSSSVIAKYRDTWKRIDSIIGELLHLLPNNTNFMIVSDHGAGPLESVFYPNTWLDQQGWLQRKNLGWKGFLAEKMSLLSEGIDNKYSNALLYYLKTKILKIYGTIDMIDIDNSLAYSPEHNTMFGCINLTQKGKERSGFKDELINTIHKLPDTVEGVKHVQVFLPEEIYSGPYVNLSPDIFFIINNYRSTVEIDFEKVPFVSAPSIYLRSGGHLPHGVFIAKGDIFKNVKLDKVSVLDIAPTILALYDIGIPSLIDGKVITECIKPEILKSLNIRISEVKEETVDQSKDQGDMDEMKKMLKSLGYM